MYTLGVLKTVLGPHLSSVNIIGGRSPNVAPTRLKLVIDWHFVGTYAESSSQRFINNLQHNDNALQGLEWLGDIISHRIGTVLGISDPTISF